MSIILSNFFFKALDLDKAKILTAYLKKEIRDFPKS